MDTCALGVRGQFSAFSELSEAEDMNARFRATMEDSHVVQDNFAGDPTQAFFGVFDGHGGEAGARASLLVLWVLLFAAYLSCAVEGTQAGESWTMLHSTWERTCRKSWHAATART